MMQITLTVSVFSIIWCVSLFPSHMFGIVLNFYFLIVVADGLGVKRDYKMAIKFFNLASQTGTFF